MTQLLIDADLIAYRVAATCEDEMEMVCYWRIDDNLQDIFETFAKELKVAATAKFFLTGKDNFRKLLDPNYKLNRRDKPKPKWLQHCRDYLITKYGAVVINGAEADDALAWNQTTETTIVSLDKDLLMIPGSHYNWVRKEFKLVDEKEGMKTFWTSMLVGDVSDNIKGIYGIGPIKAKRLLEGRESNEEMFDTVRSIYADDGRFLMNCNLLWITRTEGQMWSDAFPELAVQLEIVDAKATEE